jgi:hypothetical protein
LAKNTQTDTQTDIPTSQISYKRLDLIKVSNESRILLDNFGVADCLMLIGL